MEQEKIRSEKKDKIKNFSNMELPRKLEDYLIKPK
jgi:hypothetical protein